MTSHIHICILCYIIQTICTYYIYIQYYTIGIISISYIYNYIYLILTAADISRFYSHWFCIKTAGWWGVDPQSCSRLVTAVRLTRANLFPEYTCHQGRKKHVIDTIVLGSCRILQFMTCLSFWAVQKRWNRNASVSMVILLAWYPQCETSVVKIVLQVINIWLVVDLPLWKILASWDDEIPIYGKIKAVFQTTNQIFIARLA